MYNGIYSSLCISIQLYLLVFISVFGFANLNAAEIEVAEELSSAYEKLFSEQPIILERLTSNNNNDVEPQLINGTPVNPKDFPAVFRMVTGGTCTATVIGPETMLLAAHCLDHMARISFAIGNREVHGICRHSAGYAFSIEKSEDFALCILSHKLSGFPYESVDVSTPAAVGERVFLTGYGCTKKDGDIDGLLRIGVSNIVDKPYSNWRDAPATIYSKSDLSAGQAVLCPGDSGGPLYRLDAGIDGPRRIIGVNSRTTYSYGVSLFAATASDPGRRFLEDMVQSYDLQICGINLNFSCGG